MSRTYEAVLDGDHLEWGRRRRDAALEKLRAMGGIKSIPDPVAWQREMRKDKPLAGRDE